MALPENPQTKQMSWKKREKILYETVGIKCNLLLICRRPSEIKESYILCQQKASTRDWRDGPLGKGTCCDKGQRDSTTQLTAVALTIGALAMQEITVLIEVLSQRRMWKPGQPGGRLPAA